MCLYKKIPTMRACNKIQMMRACRKIPTMRACNKMQTMRSSKNIRIRTIITVLLIAGITGPSFSAVPDSKKGAIGVTARADKEQIAIGDRIKLDIFVKDTAGKEVLFPEAPEKFGDFTVIEAHPLKAKWPRKETIGQAYVLSIYTTGTHVIPPVQVKYRVSHKDEWRAEESRQIPIDVRSVLTGNDTDIKDLKGLVLLKGNMFWFLVLVIVLAGAAILWLLWRRKMARTSVMETGRKFAHEIAYDQLDKLQAMDLPGKGKVKEYYIRLSDIVRRYLENRFSYRVPEMTTEEFLSAIRKAKEFKDQHRELLKRFLSHCDMVKFAKYGPTPLEMLDSFKAARQLIDQTRLKEEEGTD
jgi:hypothetical protein